MSNDKRHTPVIALFDHVFHHACKDKTFSKSWRNLNDAIHQTVLLAIRSGMQWQHDDYDVIARSGNGGAWRTMGIDETYYLANNISACHSVERYLGRAPWMWLVENRSSYARLYVRARTKWDGENAVVTSFQTDDQDPAIIVCAYYDWPINRKVRKRYRITRQDLRDAKKVRKEGDA